VSSDPERSTHPQRPLCPRSFAPTIAVDMLRRLRADTASFPDGVISVRSETVEHLLEAYEISRYVPVESRQREMIGDLLTKVDALESLIASLVTKIGDLAEELVKRTAPPGRGAS